MENCLVTKFKAMVENNNLPVFEKITTSISANSGVIQFIVSTYDTSDAAIIAYNQNGVAAKVTVDNDAYFTEYNQSASLGSSLTIYPNVRKSYDLHLPNQTAKLSYERYKFPFIYGVQQELDKDWTALNNIYSFTSKDNIYIDFANMPSSIIKITAYGFKNWSEVVKLTNLNTLSCNGGTVDLNDIPIALWNSTKFKVFTAGAGGLHGNVNKINGVNLTTLTMQNNQDLTGNLDDTFTQWATAGKTGNMTLRIYNNPLLTMSPELTAIADASSHTIKFENSNWSIVS